MSRMLNRGILVLTGLSCALAVAGRPVEEWPQISPGIWHVRAKRTLSTGKVERWERTSKHCQDATILFKGYWGKANLDKAGCQFDAKRVGPTTYQISSECLLLTGGKSIGVATVTVENNRKFQMTVHITENQKHSSAFEEGELVSGCPEE